MRPRTPAAIRKTDPLAVRDMDETIPDGSRNGRIPLERPAAAHCAAGNQRGRPPFGRRPRASRFFVLRRLRYEQPLVSPQFPHL